MLCELRTKAIKMSATFPFTAPGRVTTLPASDFDVISGNGCPIISFPIFELLCSALMKSPRI
ncbi:hypothetical protein EO98_02815 [Methanosarcina sp. 2.H.T.1A.6]|nr:hypothetical protein EO94_03160 [Methanosarcina sp. 2.H.T.1A.3]KKG20944.1 hypothetical protein EO97_12190 [Methanosarcina sp. 2.H.T.1A.15]KKG22400.1 hypothetical protein EO96_08260 [Methanosarcina sp. 2.H.T.1A.8]KKG22480.1 hypothetical protein EO98_02815 [Methanosarcina sp. 2.H.T.1A.6]KKH96104.1 hypothetical protein EO95_16395 [Methanosarcina sp. 1.H.T.1A.1]